MPVDVCELSIRGPGRNALSSSLMESLLAQIRAAAGAPLLLVGADGVFSAGLDLKEVAAFDRGSATRFLGLFDDLLEALYYYQGPTVACVNGHAIAGGCMLALACDLRIASADAKVRIGLNEVPLGLEFPPKLWALVHARVPGQWLERVVLEGALHAPEAASRYGLVDEVAADPLAAARAALVRLAASPAAAYAAAKRGMRDGALALSEAQKRHYTEHIIPAWCAPVVKERIESFLGRAR